MTQRRPLIVQQEQMLGSAASDYIDRIVDGRGLRQRVITQPRPEVEVAPFTTRRSRLVGPLSRCFGYVGFLTPLQKLLKLGRFGSGGLARRGRREERLKLCNRGPRSDVSLAG